MAVIALIPARGGSKGLPRKNVISCSGKPLIEWTIEAALAVPHVDEVYVTTEDDEIKRVSTKAGSKIIDRPQALSEDSTLTDPVVSHAINELALSKEDVIVLLQPTSPCRTSMHIKEALSSFCERQNGGCLISVTEAKGGEAKVFFEDEDGGIRGMLSADAPFMRRQDLPRTFYANGALYIFNVEDFCEHQVIPRNLIVPFLMSEKDSIDVDVYSDLKLAEQILEKING